MEGSSGRGRENMEEVEEDTGGLLPVVQNSVTMPNLTIKEAAKYIFL